MATTLVSAAARPGNVSRRLDGRRVSVHQRVSVLSRDNASAPLSRILPTLSATPVPQVDAAFQSAL